MDEYTGDWVIYNPEILLGTVVLFTFHLISIDTLCGYNLHLFTGALSPPFFQRSSLSIGRGSYGTTTLIPTRTTQTINDSDGEENSWSEAEIKEDCSDDENNGQNTYKQSEYHAVKIGDDF